MNLILDIGNSGTKLAIFENKKIKCLLRSKGLSYEETEKKLSPYKNKIDKAIISSVKLIPDFIIDLLTVNIPFYHVLSNKSKLPFNINYETPETLGSDRLAAVAGAYFFFPGSNILVIDAGTAITFDFLAGNNYKGGNISPGLDMRFRALHKFTGRLPYISSAGDYSSPGNNTREAITAGVINGMIFEINEYIRTFVMSYEAPIIILTGGDGGKLKDRINHQITHIPELVMEGLNYLLEYNAE